jgi:very-short-patch-repair endonuclease
MPHERTSNRQRGSAKRLRREMTDAERKLWRALRAHRFEQIAFRRQMPMGPYIVDFVSHRMRLVVEVDGGQHGFAGRQKHDTVRDTWLASRGYRVLRFWNNEVLTNLDGVLTAILAALPPSQPSPASGEGYEPVADLHPDSAPVSEAKQ